MTTARRRSRTTERLPSIHHQILGVSRDATLDEVKAAYRRHAREVHPDANPGDPSAAERFQALTVAYEALAATAQPAEPPEPHPGDEASTTDSEPSDTHAPSQPYELPPRLADGIVRCIVVLPAMWGLAGLPGVLDRRFGDLSPLHAAAVVGAGAFAWFAVGAALWSRASSLRAEPSRWRSPGWDGTALTLRATVTLGLAWGSTSILLLPYVEEGPTIPAWRLGPWLVAVTAGWIAAGQVPRQLGYQSLQDRLRLAEEGLPARGASPPKRNGPHRERVHPKHANRREGKQRLTPLSF